jgi:anthraniloyl-CoA monooxygenase
MTCVSADARITPGCPGMYTPEHTAAWKRIVDFVHEQRRQNRLQLGHAGAKGSTRAMWDGIDQPLPKATGRWSRPRRSSTCPACRRWRAKRREPTWTASKADFVRATLRRTRRASTGWSCTARTATCCRPSSRR